MKTEKQIREIKQILQERLKYLNQMNRKNDHIINKLDMVNIILEDVE